MLENAAATSRRPVGKKAGAPGDSFRRGWQFEPGLECGFEVYASLMKQSPCVTTRSDIWVGCQGRTLVPLEKCLLHLLPIHTVNWPFDINSSVVSAWAGNTMHATAATDLASALRHAVCSRWGILCVRKVVLPCLWLVTPCLACHARAASQGSTVPVGW